VQLEAMMQQTTANIIRTQQTKLSRLKHTKHSLFSMAIRSKKKASHNFLVVVWLLAIIIGHCFVMPNSPQQDLKSILFMQSSLALSISDKINQMKQPRLYPLFWMIRTVQGGLFDHLHQWS
jgi:hypothetical protein